MKINNKHTVEKGIEQRLQSYRRQASVYQNTKHKSNSLSASKLMKSSLLALAPLAAQAQCNIGNIDLSSTLNTVNCTKIARIDVDGDGVDDFGIGVQTSFIDITAINPLSNPSMANVGAIPAYPSRFLADDVAYNATASIQMFQAMKTTFGAGVPFVLSADGGIGDFYTPIGSTTSGYLVINMGGLHGFIEITIDHSAMGERCISIGDYGLESVTNPETVLVGNCATLPVELSSFKANAVDKSILLDWQTQSEYQNAGFELQRSTDAQDFRKITWVDGHGTTSEAQRYQFKDEKVISNKVYYYRLKQINEDGSFEYSNVISANVKDSNALEISEFYPNPSNAQVQLQVQAASDTDAILQLFDNGGTAVKELQLPIEKGANTLQIDVDELADGIYFARIDIQGERIYRKVSVIH